MSEINSQKIVAARTADKNKEVFHDRHEEFTNLAYSTPGMLPDRYVFILTTRCNLNCSFCYQKKDRRQGGMSAADWINLAKQLPDYARVTMTGGEPLVFRGFERVFAYVAERFDCNIISNGLLLNETNIEMMLSYPKFKVLSISIDDIGDTLRGVAAPQWAYLKKMMRHFIEKRNAVNPDCVFEIKTVILDENAGDLLKIHRYFVEEIGCDHHSFMLLKGSPIQHADYMFDYDEILRKSNAPVYKKFETIKEQLEKVRRYNLRTGKTAFLHPKLASLVSSEPLPELDYVNVSDFVKENYLPCKYPWSSLHINADGNVFPCLAIYLGNVREASLREIVNGKELTRFKELIQQEGTVEGCNRCGWLRPNRSHSIRDEGASGVV